MLEREERVLDGFCKQDSSKFMRTSFSLELGVCLVTVPSFNVEIPDVEVQSFRHHRAGGDCPVRSIRGFVFTMTFEDDASIDSVDLSNGNIVYIRNESIKKEIEVLPAYRTSKGVVVWSHSIKITHIRLHALEELERSFFGDSWNGGSSLAEFKNVGEVHGEAEEMVRL